MRSLSERLDGRPLAAARIGVGVALLINVAECWMVLTFAEREGLPMPTWDWLPTLSSRPTAIISGIGATAAIFVIAGLWSRVAGPIAAMSLATMFVWEQQAYSNHLLLSMWCALWLGLSQADARWSLRARIDGPRPVQLADQVLLMTQLSVVYLFTGGLKINPGFLSGDVIAMNSRWDLPDVLYPVMAVSAVVVELGLAVGLWIPRLRGWVAAAGVGLHISIPVVMHNPISLTSFSILVVSLYPLFFARRVGGAAQRSTDSTDE